MNDDEDDNVVWTQDHPVRRSVNSYVQWYKGDSNAKFRGMKIIEFGWEGAD